MNDSTTEQPAPTRTLVGPAEAARLFGITARRVRTLCANRRLETIRLPGSRPMIVVEELRELLQASTTPALFGSGTYR
jgi:hypothetical protein